MLRGRYGRLRKLIASLPNDAGIEIFNASHEWYGVSEIEDGLTVIDGRLVIHFGREWTKDDVLLYRKRRGEFANVKY